MLSGQLRPGSLEKLENEAAGGYAIFVRAVPAPNAAKYIPFATVVRGLGFSGHQSLVLSGQPRQGALETLD